MGQRTLFVQIASALDAIRRPFAGVLASAA
jgi:hypothetical protein